jgi:hypothetical protein
MHAVPQWGPGHLSVDEPAGPRAERTPQAAARVLWVSATRKELARQNPPSDDNEDKDWEQEHKIMNFYRTYVRSSSGSSRSVHQVALISLLFSGSRRLGPWGQDRSRLRRRFRVCHRTRHCIVASAAWLACTLTSWTVDLVVPKLGQIEMGPLLDMAPIAVTKVKKGAVVHESAYARRARAFRRNERIVGRVSVQIAHPVHPLGIVTAFYGGIAVCGRISTRSESWLGRSEAADRAS